MPIPGSQQTITATPTPIVAASTHAQIAEVRNAGATNSVFLGDSTVTATGGANPGFELIPGANTVALQFDPNESLYAVCGAGLTTRVDVIQSYSN